MISLMNLDRGFNQLLDVTLGQPRAQPAAAPPSSQLDPDLLFKKLTGIKVLGNQVISDEDARGVSDALVATVQHHAYAEAERGARQGAKKIIVPVVAIAAAAAVVAVLGAWAAGRRAKHAEARQAQRTPRYAESYAGLREGHEGRERRDRRRR